MWVDKFVEDPSSPIVVQYEVKCHCECKQAMKTLHTNEVIT